MYDVLQPFIVAIPHCHSIAVLLCTPTLQRGQPIPPRAHDAHSTIPRRGTPQRYRNKWKYSYFLVANHFLSIKIPAGSLLSKQECRQAHSLQSMRRLHSPSTQIVLAHTRLSRSMPGKLYYRTVYESTLHVSKYCSSWLLYCRGKGSRART